MTERSMCQYNSIVTSREPSLHEIFLLAIELTDCLFYVAWSGGWLDVGDAKTNDNRSGNQQQAIGLRKSPPQPIEPSVDLISLRP